MPVMTPLAWWQALPPKARAVLLMITAVTLFSVMDACAKALGARTGPVPAIWARYLGQTLVVLIIVAPRLRQVIRTAHPRIQLLRSVLLMCGTTLFFISVTQLDLAVATAIMNINPVLITLGAALFLGEKIGLRRAVGIGVALLGALVIIRPGMGVFQPAALLPVAAALVYSGYNLATRFVRRDDSWTSLLYTAGFGTVVMSVAVPFFWVPPDGIAIALMLAIAAAGTTSQICLIRALSLGEAGMLAPFAYVGLLSATMIGAVVFDEWPDIWTWVGGAMIVGAGLYVWAREMRAKA